MSKKRRSRRAERCAYCGEASADTRDHVPPKRLFPSPLPSNLITVPSHDKCNNDYSLDEEYVVSVLVGEGSFYGNTSADRVVAELFPEFHYRRRREGLARRLKKEHRRVQLQSPGGIYLGAADGIEIDTQRVNRVLRKIIRGLFYHEYGRPCPPPEPWVEIKPDPRMTDHPFFHHVLGATPRVLGDDVFSYRHRAIVDNPDATVWLLMFYGCVPAIGITGNKQPMERRRREVLQELAAHDQELGFD